ncbi:unnamed protein product [Spirodela intermedia]|uniref:Pentatricopeptide repeat-containing protein n=1 Tax=Spirodela intermedia TaxID=51605 RepID=A0ABN7EA42_SPIIN|nr:unnamed protein product [Spirodela intermedia]
MGAASVPRFNRLIGRYGNEGRLLEARVLFDEMPERNVYTWNAMICGYARNGDLAGARALFDAAPERDAVTYNTMIAGYGARGGSGAAHAAAEIFTEMRQSGGEARADEFTLTAMLKLAAGLGDAGADADGYGAAALIDAYSKCVGRFEEALLQAAPGGGEAAAAKNAALAALCRQGEMEAAFELFFSGGGHAASPPVEIVAWNTLIAGCVKNGLPKLALHLFDEMSQGGIPWNEHTLVSILRACSALRSLSQGKQAHAWAIKKEDLGRNPHVGAAVVDFYRHCGELSSAEAVHSASCRRNPFATASMVAGFAGAGRLGDARRLYDSIPAAVPAAKNPAALTALLSAYFRRGLFDQVGELLRDACSSSSTLDESLFVNLLAACADQAELGRGKELHGRMVRAGFCPAEGRAGGALVDMYAKCGEIGGAARVFKRVPHKDLVHCNTMLAGLARHGRALEALQLFKAITAELRPDGATFTAVLSACGHAGLVDAGEAVFASMAEVHGVSPELGHYCCMVDLYGRAGRVKEALEMVGRLPFRPDAVLWGALLDACRRRHGGAAGAREVGEKLLAAAGGSDGARYVQVANAFAAEGEWAEVERIRRQMRARRARRAHGGGRSWVYVGGAAAPCCFASGDRFHPHGSAIYETLAVLHGEMAAAHEEEQEEDPAKK